MATLPIPPLPPDFRLCRGRKPTTLPWDKSSAIPLGLHLSGLPDTFEHTTAPRDTRNRRQQNRASTTAYNGTGAELLRRIANQHAANNSKQRSVLRPPAVLPTAQGLHPTATHSLLFDPSRLPVSVLPTTKTGIGFAVSVPLPAPHHLVFQISGVPTGRRGWRKKA